MRILHAREFCWGRGLVKRSPERFRPPPPCTSTAAAARRVKYYLTTDYVYLNGGVFTSTPGVTLRLNHIYRNVEVEGFAGVHARVKLTLENSPGGREDPRRRTGQKGAIWDTIPTRRVIYRLNGERTKTGRFCLNVAG